MNLKKVNKSFFEDSTLKIAEKLIGCFLVHDLNGKKKIGKIIETEAYLEKDPASHSFKGRTKRHDSMFLEAGSAYVYTIYGMHECLNVVTNKKGIGEAVLIRAIEPIQDISQKSDGPAKLVKALGIEKNHDGVDLINGPLRLMTGASFKGKITRTKRIGISKGEELPYRFLRVQ